MNEFGKKFVELRKAKGYTQDELAKKLFVSRQAVSKWETGKSMPSADVLNGIARLFDVDLEELIDNEDVCEITLNNSKKISKIKKTYIIICIVLIITLVLGIVGCVIGVLVNKKIDKGQLIPKPDAVVGVFVDVQASWVNRDGEFVTLNSLKKERKPYFLTVVEYTNNDDLGTWYNYTYGISDVQVMAQKVVTGTLAYDPKKFSNDDFITYYTIKINGDDNLYLEFSHYTTGIINATVPSNAIPRYIHKSINDGVYNLSINIDTKRIYSETSLSLSQFMEDNTLISTDEINQSTKEFTLNSGASYVTIKTIHIDEQGNENFSMETKSLQDIIKNSFIDRMITDEVGFVMADAYLRLIIAS